MTPGACNGHGRRMVVPVIGKRTQELSAAPPTPSPRGILSIPFPAWTRKLFCSLFHEPCPAQPPHPTSRGSSRAWSTSGCPGTTTEMQHPNPPPKNPSQKSLQPQLSYLFPSKSRHTFHSSTKKGKGGKLLFPLIKNRVNLISS